MDYHPPGSSVNGILQARVLEWVVISFSRGSSQPRDGAHESPALAGEFFTTSVIWEAHASHISSIHGNLKVVLKTYESVQLFATLWTILSMEFSRPEYWSR